MKMGVYKFALLTLSDAKEMKTFVYNSMFEHKKISPLESSDSYAEAERNYLLMAYKNKFPVIFLKDGYGSDLLNSWEI